MNVTGRFSVAIFGLTYNLVDQPDLEMPPTPTNWTSTVLLAKNATDFNEIEKLHGKDPTLPQDTSFSQQI